jgi:hypothetical protein
MKQYEYTLILDDIVMEVGTMEAGDDAHLEELLQDKKGVWNRYTFKEIEGGTI